MLHGYFDDSGSKPNSFGFIVGGYMMSAQD